jgi:hypothetical protein
MLDRDFQTLCLMTAVIRTTKGGATGKAWGSALEEAVSGYALILKNRHEISKIAELQSATEDGSTQDSPLDNH